MPLNSPAPSPFRVRPAAATDIDAIFHVRTSVRENALTVTELAALGITPAGASPAYWRTLGNRLAARLPLPEYSAERHAAWLAGRALP